MNAFVSKEFPVGDVLAVTSGIWTSCGTLVDVCRCMSYVLGRPVFTHEIPQATRLCREEILKQRPELDGLVPDTLCPNTFVEWHRKIVQDHGEFVSLRAMGSSSFAETDPVSTLDSIGVKSVLVLKESQ